MQQSNQSRAYRTSQRLGSSARDTEAHALLEAARRLDAAVRDPGNRDVYRSALRLNWRLWTIIQADVSSEGSPLLDEIRQNILSLSVFIDRHTVKALAEPDAARLSVLIEINRNIAAGLMVNVEAAGAAAASPSESGGVRTPAGGDILT